MGMTWQQADGDYEVAGHVVHVVTMPPAADGKPSRQDSPRPAGPRPSAPRPSDSQPSTLRLPVLYWPMMSELGEAAHDMAELIRGLVDLPFILVACEADDWERDLSPWPAPGTSQSDVFPGEGPRFLAWLLHDCIPFVEGSPEVDSRVESSSVEGSPVQSPRPRAIGGYSLAGLFSAWAFLESGAFKGLASCSGSLWFPGWGEWACERHAPQGSVAYLSLGRKEPRVRNKVVVTVGKATEEFAHALAQDPAIRESTLVWNPGGHFNDPNGRTAAGFAWLLERL